MAAGLVGESRTDYPQDQFSGNGIGSDGARQKGRAVNVYGPYREVLRTMTRYKVIVRRKGQKGESLNFETEAAAEQFAAKARRDAAEVNVGTIAECLPNYREYLAQKGNKPRTIERTMERLYLMFRDVQSTPIARLSTKTAQALADKLRTYRTKRGKLLADDSRLNMVNEAKTFGRWCERRGLIRAGTITNVEAVGRRRKGKVQLRVDEARKFEATARQLAEGGDVGAIAALVPLYLGTRASEAVIRRVRDLDDNGKLLWLEDGKTRASTRHLVVPPVLGAYLARLTEGKEPHDLLFTGRALRAKRRVEDLCEPRHWVRRQVHRICKLAGVPLVGAHGLRGTHSSLAMEAGQTARAVAAALGHTSTAMTLGHYVKQSSADGARIRRVGEVLSDGPVVETAEAKIVSTGDPKEEDVSE